MNMKECWLPIKGYEGLYEISNFGEIRSLDRITPQLNCFGSISKRIYKGTILSIRKPKGKYPYVLLSKNGTRIDILKGHADILSKGYTSCGVSAVLTGRQKTHRGFYFKLEENND